MDMTTYQRMIDDWMEQCFQGATPVERRKKIRAARFLEEALELFQATECTEDDARALVAYVFGRPVGDPPQEVGGVMVTLAALCTPCGIDLNHAACTELERIHQPEVMARIRAKQASKLDPNGPLPSGDSAGVSDVCSDEPLDENHATVTALAKHWSGLNPAGRLHFVEELRDALALGVRAKGDDLRQQAEKVCGYLGAAYDGEPRRVIEALVARTYGVATPVFTEAEVLNAARCAGLDEQQWLRVKAYLPVRPAGVADVCSDEQRKE